MNNYAISTSGVAEALQRSAGALAAANNSIDESIALAVGMNNVTQDPARVGTALKTLSMYLRASKTELEEAGESTEGMAESTSKLRAEILALTGNKVDIMLSADEYKSTYQIMKDLSEVWHDLSDITQANILERIGGKRMASINASLIENFKDVEAALQTSQSASGSALAENEKYLNSIQGKMTQLKATGQDLATQFLNSGLVKGVLSLANALGTLLEKLTGFVGVMPVLAGAGGLTALLKNLG